MKNLLPLFALLILFLAVDSSAQVPDIISYQAQVTNENGVMIPDGDYEFTFQLYNSETGGTALWSETQTLSVVMGVIDVHLGAVSQLNLDFENPYWLGITVEQGTEITPRILLTTSPYSFMSATVIDGAIDESKLAEGAVTTNKIAPGAVTGDRLADNSVNSVKIINRSVESEDISQMGASNGQILTWNDGWFPADPPEFEETDPVFNSSPASSVTVENKEEWDMAFQWGDHALAGYLSTATPAGGDLEGDYPDPVIRQNVIGSDKIIDGSIIGEDIDGMGAAEGQILMWNAGTWTPGDIPEQPEIDPVYSSSPASSITHESIMQWDEAFDWGDHAIKGYISTATPAGGDLSGTYPNPVIADGAIDGDNIAQMGASDGQVLTWNSGTWTPADVSGGSETDPIYSASPSSSITESNINNWNAAYGWGDHSTSGYLSTATAAGGDLSGSFPNPTIADGAIDGDNIAQMGASVSQVLKWNGTQWAPQNDVGGGSGDNWGTQVVETNATLDGTGVTGNELKIAQQGASSGQVLKWNGTTWEPDNESDPVYSSSAASSVTGSNINNWNAAYGWGDHSTSGYLSTATAAGGDLSGSFPNPTIADGAIDSDMISTGTVVKSVNSLHDDIGIIAGNNVNINTAGTTITISATLSGTGGNTLDQAYDQGGAGAGREINADNGAVYISGTDGLIVDGKILSGTSETDGQINVDDGAIKSYWQHEADGVPSIFVDNQNTGASIGISNDTWGIYSMLGSDGTDAKTAIAGSSYGDNGKKYGVSGSSWGSNENYGVYGSAASGSYNYGVYGETGTTNSNYALYGKAEGSGAMLNVGVYGKAANGTTNWAGYFEDDVYINNSLGIGIVNPTQALDINGAIKLSNTTTNETGSIRWNGANFQGYDGSSWLNLDASGGGSGYWNLSGSELSPDGDYYILNDWSHADDGQANLLIKNENDFYTNTLPSSDTYGIISSVADGGAVDKTAILGLSTGDNSDATAIKGKAYGGNIALGTHGMASGATTNYGTFGDAWDGSINYGVYGYGHSSSGTNYGVYGSAENGTTNWSGYFDDGNFYVKGNAGFGTTDVSNGQINVDGGAIYSDWSNTDGGTPNILVKNHSGTWTYTTPTSDSYGIISSVIADGNIDKTAIMGSAKGLESQSTGVMGIGFGGEFATGTSGFGSGAIKNYGIFGNAYGGNTNYGVYGVATSSHTNYGVYGTTENGTTNWSGYFDDGNFYVKGNAGFGTTDVSNGQVNIEGGRLFVDYPNAASSYGVAYFQNHNSSSALSSLPAATHGIISYASSDGTEYKAAIYGNAFGSNGRCFGVEGQATGSDENTGVYGLAQGTGATTNYGLQAFSLEATTNYGLYSVATSQSPADNNYGVYSTANGATTNWSGYFDSGNFFVGGNAGFGTTATPCQLNVAGGIKLGNSNVTQAGVIAWDGTNFKGHDGSNWLNLDASGGSSYWTLSGSELSPSSDYSIKNDWEHTNDGVPNLYITNHNGIYSTTPVGGTTRGGFISVSSDGTETKYGLNISSTGQDGICYGLVADAWGDGYYNYGIYSTANGATTNWSGYFNAGNFYVGGNAGFGTTATPCQLNVAGGIKLGNSTVTQAGVIVWDGTNFKGHDGSNWVELDASGGSSYWTLTSGVLYTSSAYGIARNGATLNGSYTSTHVNLGGGTSTTGGSSYNGNYVGILSGYGNSVDGNSSVIAGGANNSITQEYSGINSGQQNEIKTDGRESFIGSGNSNIISNYQSGVVSGYGNTVSGYGSFIGSGLRNKSTHAYSAVVGGADNEAGGNETFVGGGSNNMAGGYWSAVVGGEQNINQSRHSFIGGGYNNNIALSSHGSVIAGGGYQVGTTQYEGNYISGYLSFIGGGQQNRIEGNRSAIVGGYSNTVTGNYSNVLGGQWNSITNNLSVITGGDLNSVSSSNSGVFSGFSNEISQSYSFVASGAQNVISDIYSSIISGYSCTISGRLSFIGSGNSNYIAGDNSTIPGGSYLKVGDRSFGYRGGINSAPTSTTDVSSEEGTFHIVDTKFFFNYNNNSDADFRVDGSEDNLIFADAGNDRVGIGTNSPSNKLQVNGPMRIGNGTVLDGTEDNTIFFGDGAYIYIGEREDDDRLDMFAGDGFYFDFDANYGAGFGRTVSSNELEVEGDASKTTAGDWSANSDRRIKTEITEIDDSFSLLLGLRPVKFKYTDWYLEKHPVIEDRFYYNFIAQEYAEVFPESVKGSGEYLENGEEILQMDSYNAQVVTIKAVQDLIKENKDLKQNNQQLQQEINDLKKQYQMLFKMVTSLQENKEKPLIKVSETK